MNGNGMQGSNYWIRMIKTDLALASIILTFEQMYGTFQEESYVRYKPHWLLIGAVRLFWSVEMPAPLSPTPWAPSPGAFSMIRWLSQTGSISPGCRALPGRRFVCSSHRSGLEMKKKMKHWSHLPWCFKRFKKQQKKRTTWKSRIKSFLTFNYCSHYLRSDGSVSPLERFNFSLFL